MEKARQRINVEVKKEMGKKAKRFLYLFAFFCILMSAIPGLTVPAYAETAPSISPTAALFDKNTEGGAYTDIDIVMTLDGCTLSGISNGSTTLTQETDYTVSGSTVTLRKEYLETLDFENTISKYTLTFNFNDESSADLVVSVVNTDRVFPRGAAVDADGNIYFASGNFILELAMVDHIQFGISMQAGKTYIIAGTGKRGSSGDGVDARKADLYSPTDVAVDADGNIYITTFAESINGGHTIREVANTSHTQWGIDMNAGYIYNIAGDPTSQSGGYAGDNGPAADAKFYGIADVVVDADGNLYISDCGNSRVRIMAAKNSDRWGISMTAGNVYTIAGTGERGYSGDGGPATAAKLCTQHDLGLDAAGNLYIFDYNRVIRVVAAVDHERYGISMKAGSIYTVAGKFGAKGPPFAGDGTKATDSDCGIGNIAVDKDGNIYIRSVGIRIVAADDGVQWGIDMTAGNIYSLTRRVYCYMAPNWEIAVDASGNNLYLLGDASIHTLSKEHNLASPTRFIYDHNPAGPDCSDINISVDSRYGSLRYLSVSYEEDSRIESHVNLLPSTAPINFTLSGNTVTIPKSYLSTLTPERTYYVNTAWNSGLASTSEIHIVDSSYDSMALDILIDAAGNRYIAKGHNVIEVPANDGLQWGINMSKGKPYIIAGNSTAGYGGDGGVSALRAVFDKTSGVVNTVSGDVYKSILNSPLEIALDSEGNLFISDYDNCRVRMVAARDSTLFGMDVKSGNIYTVAGCGYGSTVLADGQPAVQSCLLPAGIALDSYGNLYITDGLRDSVRIVARTTQSRWGIPMEAGNMYTLAGNQRNNHGGYHGYTGDGGPAALSQLYDPYGIAFDTSGNLYIVDHGNDVIRMIAANDGTYWGIPMTANYIYTIAGKVGGGYTGDGGYATDATMNNPEGLAFDTAGNLYIADTSNGAIREVVAKNNKIYTVISEYAKHLTFDSAGNLYFLDHWPMQAPLPNDAGLSSVLGQTISTVGTGADVSSPMQATVNVDSSVTAVTSSDIASVHSDAEVIFYGADSSFTAPAAGSVSLTAGEATHVYIKVKAPAGLELFYDLTVNRAAAVVPIHTTVSNPTITGFTIALSPALPGLTASNFTLLDSSSQPISITSALTSDSGATYAISAALSAGQTYTLTVTDTGYSFGTAQSVEVPAAEVDECFIATAAFGSKFTWPVALLRHFRDQYLLTHSWGTAFVKFYYQHSPPIAAVIATSQPLKMLVRVLLAPVIAIVYIIYHPILMVTVLGLLIVFLTYRFRLRRKYLEA